MILTRQQVFKVISDEAEYAKRYDVEQSTFPRHVADCDKPVEQWLLWIEQYLHLARQAVTSDYKHEGALTNLRIVLSLGVNCAIYHGLPRRGEKTNRVPVDEDGLTRASVYAIIEEEMPYTKRWDTARTSSRRSLADKDKPLEVWLLWMEVYLSKARSAAMGDLLKREALEHLRCLLALGVNCATYHGLPPRVVT